MGKDQDMMMDYTNNEYNSELIIRDFHAFYWKTGGKQSDPIFKHFQSIVYDYYKNFGRDLPWRKTDDPYHIVVSEIMLQQTQVPRAISKYPEFLAAFPTIETLAQAPFEEVLLMWQGLGYNRRAKYLHLFAKTVVEKLKGKIPATPLELSTLPGIGKATASSIAVFAFNYPAAFIETNIRTVFIHFFFDTKTSVTDDDVLPLVEATIDRENPRRWYSALMDYGTMLKKRYSNPGRKSAHYKRQGKFKGSKRELRGKIIAFLLQTSGRTVQEIAQFLTKDKRQIQEIVDDLIKEDFITTKKKKLWIK